MKSSSRSLAPIGVGLALVGLLVLLAALQYSWTGQLSRAERERLDTRVRADVAQLAQDFDREITRALVLFSGAERDGGGPAATMARNLTVWADHAVWPELVADVWLARDDGDGWRLERVEAGGGVTEGDNWPEELAPVRAALDTIVRAAVGRRLGPPPLIVPEAPALILPLARGGREPREPHERPPPFALVRFDREAIAALVLPQLSRRYFGDADEFHVAVLDRGVPVWSSGGDAQTRAPADASSPMFGFLHFEEFRELVRESDADDERGDDGASRGSSRRSLGPVFSALYPDTPRPWSVEVTHRAGSLAAAVAHQRFRNLAISSAVLLLLAVSVGLVLVSARRAFALSRQRLEFVAGVTHELRTPLAVICSAGQNLADGITTDAAQTRRYGDVIRREGERLAGLVEQVLDLAAIHSGRLDRTREPLAVADWVEGAIADCAPLADERGARIERNLAPDLPEIRGDARSLRQALANLISNAIRHSEDDPLVTIHATAAPGRRGTEIAVTVEDRGPGIDPAELPRIFEPFFRGRRAARVRGSGLGLSLVRQIVEAHGGRVTVESTPGRGSRFTLRLHAIPAPQPTREPGSTRAAGSARV